MCQLKGKNTKNDSWWKSRLQWRESVSRSTVEHVVLVPSLLNERFISGPFKTSQSQHLSPSSFIILYTVTTRATNSFIPTTLYTTRPWLPFLSSPHCDNYHQTPEKANWIYFPRLFSFNSDSQSEFALSRFLFFPSLQPYIKASVELRNGSLEGTRPVYDFKIMLDSYRDLPAMVNLSSW